MRYYKCYSFTGGWCLRCSIGKDWRRMRRLARSFSGQDIFFSWRRQVICFRFKWPRQVICFLFKWPRQVICFLFKWPKQVIFFLFKWPRQDIYFLNGQRNIYIIDYRYTWKITDILSKWPIQDIFQTLLSRSFQSAFHL